MTDNFNTNILLPDYFSERSTFKIVFASVPRQSISNAGSRYFGLHQAKDLNESDNNYSKEKDDQKYDKDTPIKLISVGTLT